MNIIISSEKFNIENEDFVSVCNNFRKRIIRILYLREDVTNNKNAESDLTSYIGSLMLDIHSAYIIFNNYKFLNCLCELESVKSNLWHNATRKKILDVASYITTIPNDMEG